ncbi:Ferredoxin [Zostera marina]|uniref:Ferredoxin n=1 Tax=Zostera marina TaxID=29655 RepID=A0A0K9NY43_ZOSMR|nr:Ferredoxin [Zostera marina]
MAAVNLILIPSPLTARASGVFTPSQISISSTSLLQRRRSCSPLVSLAAYKVSIEHEGETKVFDVEEDESILEKALEEGLDVPCDCMLGVCMTCPAKLISGSVDQSQGMLSDDVIEKGYTLLCVSNPVSDCVIRTIPEEELLSLQLVTSND